MNNIWMDHFQKYYTENLYSLLVVNWLSDGINFAQSVFKIQAMIKKDPKSDSAEVHLQLKGLIQINILYHIKML